MERERKKRKKKRKKICRLRLLFVGDGFSLRASNQPTCMGQKATMLISVAHRRTLCVK